MRRATRAAAALAAVALISGCGEDLKRGLSKPVRERELKDSRVAAQGVIRRWASALRAGDTAAAARLFALPSVAENGPPAIRIRSREDAELFNLSLPCGARVIAFEPSGRFVTATFRLTERPGGDCGTGTGQTAKTRFLVRGGRIAEWRRIGDPDAGDVEGGTV
jgi:hypothetical protein